MGHLSTLEIIIIILVATGLHKDYEEPNGQIKSNNSRDCPVVSKILWSCSLSYWPTSVFPLMKCIKKESKLELGLNIRYVNSYLMMSKFLMRSRSFHIQYCTDKK